LVPKETLGSSWVNWAHGKELLFAFHVRDFKRGDLGQRKEGILSLRSSERFSRQKRGEF